MRCEWGHQVATSANKLPLPPNSAILLETSQTRKKRNVTFSVKKHGRLISWLLFHGFLMKHTYLSGAGIIFVHKLNNRGLGHCLPEPQPRKHGIIQNAYKQANLSVFDPLRIGKLNDPCWKKNQLYTVRQYAFGTSRFISSFGSLPVNMNQINWGTPQAIGPLIKTKLFFQASGKNHRFSQKKHLVIGNTSFFLEIRIPWFCQHLVGILHLILDIDKQLCLWLGSQSWRHSPLMSQWMSPLFAGNVFPSREWKANLRCPAKDLPFKCGLIKNI